MTELWIFAYGSLLFRPDFAISARIPGKVKGYSRRFWQRSSDHRGTPESPGRVVTLIEEQGAECAGVAYCVAPEHCEDVLFRLAHREKGGYSLITLPFVSNHAAQGPREVSCYVALPDNSEFCGPEDDSVTADVIRVATGPSGHNTEYLLRLAETLEQLGIFDSHVFRMANLVSDPDHVFEEQDD